MLNEKSKTFGACITKLINGVDMSREEAKEMFCQVLLNEQSDIQQGAFLAALVAKGETAGEIAGSWEAIYELDTVKVTPDRPYLVENCGTGMDAIKTFNISTAASIIAAAAGIPMAKHGARAITSVCGTVDILEELGVDVECSPEVVKKSIEKAGIGIFNGMSPQTHPMALGRILSQISFGTTLNIAASLANPAMPRYGVRGVYSKDLVEPVARVMSEIGYKKAIVLHGLDEDGRQGMDEASTLGETIVAELMESGEIKQYSLFPGDIGIKRARRQDLAPSGNREEEAVRIMAIMSGRERGPRTDIVCLNAAFILYLMKIRPDLQECFQLALEIIGSGKAAEKLKEWVCEQNVDPGKGMARLNRIMQQALN
ncbi:MAG: anthranilate phosphoribosyltransferase [Bacillota bacterium]